MAVNWYRFANSSTTTFAMSVTRNTGIHSAGTRSSQITAPGTARIVAPAETGKNGTAKGATAAPTVSHFHVKTAVEVSEANLSLLPGLIEKLQIFLSREPTDMRKGHDGLAALVQGVLAKDLYSGHLFVFLSKRRDRVKVLTWDRGGLVLWYKRLEKDRFSWPREANEQAVTLTGKELNWLLDGIDLFRLRPHENLSYLSVL